MTGRLVRGGFAALSVAAIVAGGAVVGAGTASAQSEEFASSVEQRNLTAVLEFPPELWVQFGLNFAELVSALALDVTSSFDLVLDKGWCSGYTLLGDPCPQPASPTEQVLDWAEGEFSS